jgi:hypothetical protein
MDAYIVAYMVFIFMKMFSFICMLNLEVVVKMKRIKSPKYCLIWNYDNPDARELEKNMVFVKNLFQDTLKLLTQKI